MANNMSPSFFGDDHLPDIYDRHFHAEQILRAVIIDDSVDSLHSVLGMVYASNIQITR